MSVALQRAHAALPSRTWSDGDPVVPTSYRGRGDLPCPRFGDDVWNLRAMVYRSNALDAACILDFTRFTDPVRRLTAKEIAMQRFNRPMAPLKMQSRPRTLTVDTVSHGLNSLGFLYEWMDKDGIARLQDLTQDDLNRFLRYTTEVTEQKPKALAQTLQIAVWLYEARDVLTEDWVGIPPWGRKSLSRIVGATHVRENRTPRIPERTMGPLLRWSLLYVDVFAPDILAAYHEYNHYLDLKKGKIRVEPPADIRAALGDWLAELRRQGRGVPARPHPNNGPNLTYIRNQIGWRNKTALVQHMDLIEIAVRELGLERNGRTKISKPLNLDITWRDGFELGEDVLRECRRLMAACYVICAYLSGMRDSEIQALKRGCYQPLLDIDGDVIRHRLESTEYKGRTSAGIDRKWVVIEPVANAIRVLEALTERARTAMRTDHLFIVMQKSKAVTPTLKRMPNAYIYNFIRFVNETLQPRLAALGIPPITIDDNCGFGRVSTRMFRRTVAWHIANQPFGVVAGMIQYGHLSEVMFEGYAGHSESGFRGEVEVERAMARQADILAVYEDAKRGILPSGPMADELVGEFEYIQKELEDFPGKIVDERRREKMLEHLRVRLFPGLIADCFFEAKDARCLRHVAEQDRVEPINGVCDPHCPHACWTQRHMAVWKNALADVKRLGKRNRISTIQRDILKTKAASYQATIDQIAKASHGD